MGIIPKKVFGQEQLDKITGLDISREDYIKFLSGIDELHNLRELYCRLGLEFDYDSVCQALSNEQLQAKRLSIKNPEQLTGYDLSRLPSDLDIVGYDTSRKYQLNNGYIEEIKLQKEITSRKFEPQTNHQIGNNPMNMGDPISEERRTEYDEIMQLKNRANDGTLKQEDVTRLFDIAFGPNTQESEQISSAILNSGRINKTNKQKKFWELEPEEKARIQKESAEIAKKT